MTLMAPAGAPSTNASPELALLRKGTLPQLEPPRPSNADHPARACGASSRPRGQTHPKRSSRRFGKDERGQLLILTGVLLVLGFVVIGTTVVQLRSLEESTSRIQRDGLLDSVDALMSNFNRTVRDSVLIGDTNLTDFKQRTTLGEERLRDTATRSGLYVSIALREDAPTTSWWRDSRCGGYSTTYTQDGVVVGYDLTTQEETIAGAVYDVHITDGRQSIRMDYYVKIFECMLINTPSFIYSVTTTTGTAEQVSAAASSIDNDAGMWLNETLAGQVTVKEVVPVKGSTLEGNATGWAPADAIKALDDVGAINVAPTGSTGLGWRFRQPPGLNANDVGVVYNMSVYIKETPGVTNDDRIWLKANYTGETNPIAYEITGLTGAYQNLTFRPPLSPTGNAHWTKDEIKKTTWRLTHENVNGADLGRIIEVDYVQLVLHYTEPEGYQLDMTFDFLKVPSPFLDHSVSLRYRVTPGTAGEDFFLQAWNDVTLDWDTIHTMADTGGTFVDSGAVVLTQAQENSNKPRFRIVDGTTNDNTVPGDLDRIEIDYFELMSSVPG